ncbi:capsule biosynthesis protein [Thioalkalivibrio sulfidiphilus]|uniref:capsule biosynthesis protein n=1 Tax=Thioalkalivibrio sulfidiphilus TaxID=1033854 RepID=UPI0003749BB7|nr:capsular biosynthesis protein [Thioalkalivibrio sulfidiphilus]
MIIVGWVKRGAPIMAQIRHMHKDFAGRHFLLLQGPMGPFFRRLAQEIRLNGGRVSKINLNAGDALFFHGDNCYAYRGDVTGWTDYVSDFVQRHEVDAIVLFGDQRIYHKPMRELCDGLGIELYVFEEGYLRPNYLTLERNGVNGHSSTPRNPVVFNSLPSKPLQETARRPTGFYHAIVYAIVYHVAMTLFAWRYPHYQHHRKVNALYQGWAWSWGALRWRWLTYRQTPLARLLSGPLSGRYFLVPLQVHDDAQIVHWSQYNSVEEFIEEIAQSFAKHASAEDSLVFKHHPMDRAYTDYHRLFRRLRCKTGLGDRLIYVHGIPMPRLLDHARGMVCVNSTTGLSALQHGVPVKILGTAFYDIPGLVSEQPLEQFWRDPGEVDLGFYHQFRNWLLLNNQLDGSFYRRLPGVDTPTAIIWEPVQWGKDNNFEGSVDVKIEMVKKARL